jgi:nicotinamidase-related amidase
MTALLTSAFLCQNGHDFTPKFFRATSFHFGFDDELVARFADGALGGELVKRLPDCLGTDLDLQLRRRGLVTIVLCGIATEFGVESTARDAYERGYELVFAEDAMTGRTAESHADAIMRIFPRIGRVRSTEEIAKALGVGVRA